MIKYITQVNQDHKVTHVLELNGKAVRVEVDSPARYDEAFKYGQVKVDTKNMSIKSDGAHLSQILVAIEMAKVINENLIEENK